MKYTLTIESEELEDLRQHTTVGDLRAAVFEFNQELRALAKYGAVSDGSVKCESEAEFALAEKIWEHFLKVINEYNASDVFQ